MRSTNSSSRNNRPTTINASSATSSNSVLPINSAADFSVSAAVAIKLEPAENLSKFDEILMKRKADRLTSIYTFRDGLWCRRDNKYERFTSQQKSQTERA
jgi:hypothetical protein